MIAFHQLRLTLPAFLAAFLCFLGASASYAQALPSSSAFPYTFSGSTFTFSGGNATAANASSLAFGNAANGAVYAQGSAALPLGNGRTVPVTVRSLPDPLAQSKAIGRFLGKVLGPLAIGVAIYDLAKELGFTLDNSGGALVVSKPDSSVCTVSPCYTFWLDLAYAGVTAKYSSVSQAAQAALPLLTAKYGGSWYISSIAATSVYFSSNQYTNWGYGIQKTVVAPSPATSLPSSVPELENAIATKPLWPANSNIGRALKDAVESGEVLPLPTPSQVTGPASVQGPTFTTNTPAQNGNPAESVTKSTVYNFNYGPNTVTSTVINTTTVNNGQTETTTTEETEPEAAPSDTANPDLPKLYERKYPDGLTGVWATRKAELMATPLPNLIGSLTPTISSSGGCPQFSLPMNIGPWNWGTYNLGPPCAVWDFLKVCVLLGAVFLVRALIFGG